MPEPKAPLTTADAVKLFAKQGITVTVVKRDKKGPVRDAVTRRFVTEAVPLEVSHIVGMAEREGEVGITTIDGKKYVQAVK